MTQAFIAHWATQEDADTILEDGGFDITAAATPQGVIIPGLDAVPRLLDYARTAIKDAWIDNDEVAFPDKAVWEVDPESRGTIHDLVSYIGRHRQIRCLLARLIIQPAMVIE